MSCQTCAHLDDSESRAAVSNITQEFPPMAGLCTKRYGWFNGRLVPVWLTGCPDFEPVTSPQGDGDGGGE